MPPRPKIVQKTTKALKELERDLPEHLARTDGEYRPEFASQIIRMTAAGHTDEEIAYILGVDVKTLQSWRIHHPKVEMALRHGKEYALKRLLTRAVMSAEGYHYKTHKTVTTKDADGKIKSVKEEEVDNYQAPDNSMLIWLITNMVRQLGLKEAQAWVSKQQIEVDQKTLQVSITPAQISDQIAQMAGSLAEGESKPETKQIEVRVVESK